MRYAPALEPGRPRRRRKPVLSPAYVAITEDEILRDLFWPAEPPSSSASRTGDSSR